MITVHRAEIARDIRKNGWWMALWLLAWIAWDYRRNQPIGFGLTTTLAMASVCAVLVYIGRCALRGWIVIGEPD